MRICMKARKRSKLGHIGPPMAELGAHERLKNPHMLKMEETVLPLFLSYFSSNCFILTGNDDIH